MARKYPQWLVTATKKEWKQIHFIQQLNTVDLYYMDLAKDIFFDLEETNVLSNFFGIEEDELVELATIIAAYFEDYIAEAGIWKAWTDRHKEVNGSYLPFFDLSDYDPEYVNWQDINLIIWMWLLRQREGKFVQPVIETMKLLSMEVADLLEGQIDEAPVNSFFEHFFEVKDEQNWMQIRPKIEFLATKSYLFGALDGKFAIEARIEEMKEEAPDLLREYNKDMVYDIMMEFAFQSKSRIGGLRMPEMAARILRGSKSMLESIAASTPSWRGEFHWKGSEGEFYQLVELKSRREIQVAKISTDLFKSHGDIVIASVVYWGDCYWVTGMVAQRPARSIDFNELASEGIVLPTSEERKQQIIAQEKLVKTFETVFGGSVELFDRVESAKQLLERFVAELKNSLPTASATIENIESQLNSFKEDSAIALYIDPYDGLVVSADAALILNFMKGEKSKPINPQSALFSLVSLFPQNVAKAAVEKYGDKSLYFEGIEFSIKDNINALSWFMNPEGTSN